MNATKSRLSSIFKKRTGATQETVKRGAKKMQEAADEIVGRDCKPIVEALSKKGKKGEMLSVKFLYDLAQSAEALAEGDGARKFRSMALEIANSPEWNGEPAPEEPGEEDAGDES